ncbi:hypothetical protein DOY81_013168 [Sarcophaga bullata]|nr:hypothetical protein DOY81_013168 [Sarcophaga bullata]
MYRPKDHQEETETKPFNEQQQQQKTEAYSYQSPYTTALNNTTPTTTNTATTTIITNNNNKNNNKSIKDVSGAIVEPLHEQIQIKVTQSYSCASS